MDEVRVIYDDVKDVTVVISFGEVYAIKGNRLNEVMDDLKKLGLEITDFKTDNKNKN